MSSPEERIRVRIRFRKLGKIRWTSHRDLARMWERAFRRVQLPLSYSEGFSPRPRVSFGLALPTGHESVAEFLDVELSGLEGVELATLAPRLSAALPVGVDATAVAPLPPGTPSLQEAVTSCSWRWLAVRPDGAAAVGPDELSERVEAALAASSIAVTRNRKGQDVTEDVRPGIKELSVIGPPEGGADEADPVEGVWLSAELTAVPRAVRPAEVLLALGGDLEGRHVRRTHQWIERHGARSEPLAEADPNDATAAPHALERAS